MRRCPPQGGHADQTLDPDKLSDHFEWLIKKSGLPPLRLHDLRHCAATVMPAAGAVMKDVSAHLGHRQFWFTTDTPSWPPSRLRQPWR